MHEGRPLTMAHPLPQGNAEPAGNVISQCDMCLGPILWVACIGEWRHSVTATFEHEPLPFHPVGHRIRCYSCDPPRSTH